MCIVHVQYREPKKGQILCPSRSYYCMQVALLQHYMDTHGMTVEHTMQKDMIARSVIIYDIIIRRSLQ